MSVSDDTYKQWEISAKDLINEDSSLDTRNDVEKHVIEINQLLEHKVKQVEETLEKDKETEKAQCKKIEQRIQSAHGQSLQNEEPAFYDAQSVYHSLKQQEWNQVYQLLIQETNESEADIFTKLIKVLKECYKVCAEKIERMHGEICWEIMTPGSTLPGKKQMKKQHISDDLTKLTEQLVKKTASKSLPYQSKKLEDDEIVLKAYKSIPVSVLKNSQHDKTIRAYIRKCIHFAWLQIIENKDIKVEDSIKNLGKTSKMYKQISKQKILCWPALVDQKLHCIVDGCDPELVNKDRPRPQIEAPDKKLEETAENQDSRSEIHAVQTDAADEAIKSKDNINSKENQKGNDPATDKTLKPDGQKGNDNFCAPTTTLKGRASLAGNTQESLNF